MSHPVPISHSRIPKDQMSARIPRVQGSGTRHSTGRRKDWAPAAASFQPVLDLDVGCELSKSGCAFEIPRVRIGVKTEFIAQQGYNTLIKLVGCRLAEIHISD